MGADKEIMLGGYPFCTEGVNQEGIVAAFAKLEVGLRAALGDNVVRVARMGSSAIPGIPGTPVCDVLLEVNAWPPTEEQILRMKENGFDHRGPAPHYKEDIWFFGGEGAPGHLGRGVIHVVPEGCSFANEMRTFVKYVTETPSAFKRYAQVKLEGAKIVEASGNDPNPVFTYKNHKEKVVEALLEESKEWGKVQAA